MASSRKAEGKPKDGQRKAKENSRRERPAGTCYGLLDRKARATVKESERNAKGKLKKKSRKA